MPITLFIGEGWNPFAIPLDPHLDPDDENAGPYPARVNIEASAEIARGRFLEAMATHFPANVAIRVEAAAEGRGGLFDTDFTDEEMETIMVGLEDLFSGRASLDLNIGDAIMIVRDLALQDRGAWVVPKF